MLISVLIKEFRRIRGLTLRKLADKIGISFQFLSLIETGKVNPLNNILVKLEQELNLSNNILVKLNEYEQKVKNITEYRMEQENLTERLIETIETNGKDERQLVLSLYNKLLTKYETKDKLFDAGISYYLYNKLRKGLDISLSDYVKLQKLL